MIPSRPSKFSLLGTPSDSVLPTLLLTPPASAPGSPSRSPKLDSHALESAKPMVAPPPRPLPWLWTCHQCGSSYPLAATRRCLQDGHTFCSGSTYDRVTGRTKRHKACNSEFDYVGWNQWAEWRAENVSSPISVQSHVHSKKNCWKECDYPSECRWGARSSIEKPARKERSLEEIVPEVPDIEPFDYTAQSAVVEHVVKTVQVTSTAPPRLSTINEDRSSEPIRVESPTSPLSPLKQHYTLPTAVLQVPSEPSEASDEPMGLFHLADESDLPGMKSLETRSGTWPATGMQQPDWMDWDNESNSSEEDLSVEEVSSPRWQDMEAQD